MCARPKGFWSDPLKRPSKRWTADRRPFQPLFATRELARRKEITTQGVDKGLSSFTA
jgi:hypothetical protein